jgi:hypothetical protein
MMSDYYDATGEWKHITGSDDYNQPTYAILNVPCKIIDKMKLVRDKTGVQVVSMSTVFTDSPVIVDDLFNGRVVISVRTMDLLDSLEGYEVSLV